MIFFGKECNNISAAVNLLQLAVAQDSSHDWVIVGEVKTDSNSDEI